MSGGNTNGEINPNVLIGNLGNYSFLFVHKGKPVIPGQVPSTGLQARPGILAQLLVHDHFGRDPVVEMVVISGLV